MPFMSMWSCILRICVSRWTWSFDVVLEQPVAVRRACLYERKIGKPFFEVGVHISIEDFLN